MKPSPETTSELHPRGIGIARQFLLLFVLGSLLPLGLLSAFVLRGASDQIREQSDQRLRQASKTAGMALLGRLSEVGRLLEHAASRGRGQPLPKSSGHGLEDAFSIVVDASGRSVVESDVPAELRSGLRIPRQPDERLVPLGSSIAMFEAGDLGAPRWGGILRASHLLEPVVNALPPGGEACLLIRPGVALGCSFDGPLPPALADPALFDSTSGPVSWTVGEEPFRGQYWSVFLRANFGADPWVIAMAEPERRLAQPLADFQLLSALMVALAFLLVLFVSVTQIRRRLAPLRALLDGTRKVAGGDFAVHVEVSTGNELEELGAAFNRMTGELRTSFEAQATLLEFDRRLLSASDEEALVELLHSTLASILPGAAAHIFVWGGTEVEGLRITVGGAAAVAKEQVKRSQEIEDWSQSLEEVVATTRSLPLTLRQRMPEDAARCLAFPLLSDGRSTGLVLAPLDGAPPDGTLAQAGGIVHRCAIALSHQRSIEANRYLRDYDRLTGLPNRSLFKDRLTRALAQAPERRTEWIVAIAGVDGFKGLNESLGHEQADRLLRVLAYRLRKVFGEEHVARLGGDEFGLMVDGSTGREQAERRIRAALEESTRTLTLGRWEIRPTLSTGASCFPEDGEDSEALLGASDAALHHAKLGGPGSLKFFTAEMSARAVERLELISALEGAAQRDELRVYYQPVLDVETRGLASVEALVRWQRPEQGLAMPGAFIEVAEERGLDVEIGTWVLHQACRDIASWEAAGMQAPRVAINLTARQLEDPRLRSTVVRALSASRIHPSRIGFELTERSLVSDTVASNLDALRALGVTLSVDDFGTGYSSLGYLQRFPLDVLKIDRSFISEVCADPQAATITRACVAMAHELGLRVVAEGVETEEQFAFLHECRCDYVQGFLFSQAIPEDGLRKWIQAGGTPGI